MNDIDARAREFVLWLATGTDEPAPQVEIAVHGSTVARRLRYLLEHFSEATVTVLVNLTRDGVATAMLEYLLVKCRSSIGRALATEVAQDRPPHSSALDHLVHVVLDIAPGRDRDLTGEQFLYLVEACADDPLVLRHLLGWTALPPSDPTPDEPFTSAEVSLLAEGIRRTFPLHTNPYRRSARAGYTWSSPEGLSLAREMITELSLDELLDAYRSNPRTTTLDLLPPLAALSPGMASVATEHARVVEDFVATASKIRVEPSRGPRLDCSFDSDFLALPTFFPMAVLDRVASKIGQAAGSELHRLELPRDTESVAQVLRKPVHEVEGTETRDAALLWADLHQLVEYRRDRWDRQDEIRGVQARLNRHLDTSPESWANSVRDILACAAALGDEVIDLITFGAAQHALLRDEIRRVAVNNHVSTLRDKAQGLLARLSGLDSPGEHMRRWLADSAAQAVDGTPMFPNPLTSPARTWLGSLDLEGTLSSSVRQAMTYFGRAAADQGGTAVEEHVTGVLLNELEVAFRNVSLRLVSAGDPTMAGAISVSHRPVHKTTEEPHWGCDVALLLHADIRSDVHLELAELVQVKKSDRFLAGKSSAPAESWRIDVPQLLQLLDRSQSAAYWLVLSTGELLCVTARWIHARIKGRGKLAQKSATIGYNDVRHAAVPMEQFLTELFLGTWVGTGSESALAFARGNLANAKPRHIFEVSVVVAREQSDADFR